MQQGRLVWASEREPIENVRDALNDRIARIYDSADGRFYVYMDADGFWERACDVLGLDGLKSDPRFATHMGHHAAREEIIAEVQEVMLTRPADEWVERLQTAGVPSARMRPSAALLEDEQMRAMGFLTRTDHSELGVLEMLGAPYRLDGVSARNAAPPLLGEHTDEVLAEAGYAGKEIEEFRKSEVIF